jgi:hypothetical protein
VKIIHFMFMVVLGKLKSVKSNFQIQIKTRKSLKVNYLGL